MRVSQAVKQSFKPVVRRRLGVGSAWRAACPMCSWQFTTWTWRKAMDQANTHADTKLHKQRRDIRLRVRVNLESILNGTPGEVKR